MTNSKRPIVILKKELENKNTKELLGYLRKLLKCEESFEHSDMEINPDLTDEDTIYFKRTDKWLKAYENVKSILNTREHIK